jgi:N-acetylmuramoyl-L-alanine amidase
MVLDALQRVPGATLNVPARASTRPYGDVDAARWSAAKIQFARDNNIISGYQDGSFRPTQPVTRAELLAVLRRTAEYGNTLRGRPAQLQATQEPRTFSDTASHWSASLVTQMSGYCGVASPVNEQGSTFEPNSPARRNYAAAATLRMLNCVRR